MRGKYLVIVLLIIGVTAFSGCKLLLDTNKSEPLEIGVKGDSFTLVWDTGGPEIANAPNSTVRYNVYYRNHKSLRWNFLMSIESSGSTECLITDEKMDYGRYDFAVSAVSEQDKESALHSSLDRTANPFSGWYINWIGSK